MHAGADEVYRSSTALSTDDPDAVNHMHFSTLPTVIGHGVYALTQKSSWRFVDAHEIEARDFQLVTRPAQGNDTQRWHFERFAL